MDQYVLTHTNVILKNLVNDKLNKKIKLLTKSLLDIYMIKS